MEIKFKKLTKTAKAPKRMHRHDAGFDLTLDSFEYDKKGNLVCHSGIAVEIPDGYVGLLFPRSSIAELGIWLTNSVGVIDSNYRGDIMAKFKMSFNAAPYKVGDRFCQLIVMPYPKVTYVDSDELSKTDRGAGGYGSTNNITEDAAEGERGEEAPC